MSLSHIWNVGTQARQCDRRVTGCYDFVTLVTCSPGLLCDPEDLARTYSAPSGIAKQHVNSTIQVRLVQDTTLFALIILRRRRSRSLQRQRWTPSPLRLLPLPWMTAPLAKLPPRLL